ncbi:MAG TPA: glycosyltransferase family 2 protein [Microscillaceae bacterium]|nr:glycosyltransferase family 2 protein [Microscillaceae bacterium]
MSMEESKGVEVRRSISVVIPNYNGRNLLEENLPSVFEALEVAAVAFEVIVVDDASTDESVDFLKTAFPQVILLQNERNRGFSPTINRGIMAATKDLVLALNSDVKLTPNYFLPLFKYFTKPDTFGVMGRILDLDGKKVQDVAKYPQQKSTGKIKSTIDFVLEPMPNDFWVPSLYLSGANALVDREKIQELGGFDEIYAPFYVEDVDLSVRAWRLGWSCYYEHEAVCHHPESVTIANYHKKRKIYVISARNKLIMHALHLQGVSKIVWNLKVFADFLMYWLALNFRFYEAFFLFLRRFRQLRQSKKRMKQLLKKYNRKESINTIIDRMRQQIEAYNVVKLDI